MRTVMPSIAGITWDRLEEQSAVTYPCTQEGDPGQRVVFVEDFPTANGRARFVPATIVPAAERPDKEYPYVLITGRQLEHWHTGSMTRRSEVLDAIEPTPVASLNSKDRARRRARRHDHRRLASWEHLAACSRRRWHAARRDLHSVLLLRGRGEPAYEPGARSFREDTGVQVLRRARERGRCGGDDARLRLMRGGRASHEWRATA